jgi:hypothetical protein
VTEEVARLSDGAYQLRFSAIQVQDSGHRVAIDTIVLTTDSLVNAGLASPRTTVTVLLRQCAIEGVDLGALAVGKGLRAGRAGCDSVQVTAEVPRRTVGGREPGTDDAVLTLGQSLRLPRDIPQLEITSVEFPAVRLGLGLTTSTGYRTALEFDRLTVFLDSLDYDPADSLAASGPLLSHDVRITLDSLEGSREAMDRLSLRHFTASLAGGTLVVSALRYAPIAGDRADSLGLVSLEVADLSLAGVAWGRLLRSGDVVLRRATGREIAVTLRHAERGGGATVAEVLQALQRRVRVDSLDLERVALTEVAGTARRVATTRVGVVRLQGMDFGGPVSAWSGERPLGEFTLSLEGLRRRRGDDELVLGTLDVSADGSVQGSGFRHAPLGNDAAFVARQRSRRDRVDMRIARFGVEGGDVADLIRTGALRARSLAIRGLMLDILSDRNLPDPAVPVTHRSVQRAIRDLDYPVALDTVRIRGAAVYRERGVDATRPGVLRFAQLEAHGTNFVTSGTPRRPFQLHAQANLMAAARLSVDFTVPLTAPRFTMDWRGTLAPMEVAALTPFLEDAMGVVLDAGQIEEISFDVVVRDGVATGVIAPRWHDLHVKLPGTPGNKGGLFDGLARSVKQLAANAFVIRDHNSTLKGDRPKNGAIDHRWTPSETLQRFLWVSLREPLLQLVK